MINEEAIFDEERFTYHLDHEYCLVYNAPVSTIAITSSLPDLPTICGLECYRKSALSHCSLLIC